MARPRIRKLRARSRPAGKRASLPVSIASAVIARLSPSVASAAATRTAPSTAKRKRGALSHPAARGKASGQRATLPAVVASAVAGRLSRAAPKRAAKPRASLAAAVASAVSQRLAAGPRTLRR